MKHKNLFYALGTPVVSFVFYGCLGMASTSPPSVQAEAAQNNLALNCDVSKFHKVLDQSANKHGDKTDCFPQNLKCMLIKTAEKYTKKVKIFSAHRSHQANNSRGGVSNSAHTRCAAADIGVDGVSSHELAKFLRESFKFTAQRGQVGEYCSGSGRVHIAANGGSPDYCGSGCKSSSAFCRARYGSVADSRNDPQ